MDCDRFLYRTPIDQLINLLQEIPFPGSAGYIVFRKTHTQHLNIIVLKRNYSIQSIDQGSQPCKGLQIYALKKAGHTQSEIATVIDRSVSTISRELARNRGARGYRPKQAHNKAVERKAINARAIDDATWQFAQEKLMLQWSP
jgi:hypothetical protein